MKLIRRLRSVYLGALLVLIGPSLALAQINTAWPWLYEPSRVLEIRLNIDRANWDVIRKDVTNTIKARALMTVTLGCDVVGSTGPVPVDVRRKSSRALPNEDDPLKIGMKVDIVSDTFLGVKKLSLENGSDSSPLKEGLAWLLHERASPIEDHAALAAWTQVVLDVIEADGSTTSIDLGMYVNVEQRDKQFLRNRSLYDAGTTWMYKQDDIGLVEREVAPSEDPLSPLYNSPAFKALCYVPFQPASAGTGGKKGGSSGGCQTPLDTQLSMDLNRWIDMGAMLRQGAVDTFTDNGDALFTKGKNFFVVDFAESRGKRRYYPWDLDGVFRSTTAGIYGVLGSRNSVAQSPYQSVILNHPLFRTSYNAILGELISEDGLGGPLSAKTLNPILDTLEANVLPALKEDPFQPASSNDIADMKKWFEARRASIRTQLVKNGPPAPRK